MNIDHFELIDLVDLSSKSDTDVEEGAISVTWDTFVSMMMKFSERDHKDGAAFIPVRLKPRVTWHQSEDGTNNKFRNDRNVESITIGIFDLDKPGALELAETVLSNYEYIIYSTHSYSITTPYKFRIALRLREPIEVSAWHGFFKDIAEQIDADLNCGNFSRLYYYPSIGTNAGIKPFFKHHLGRPISLTDYPRTLVQAQESANNSPAFHVIRENKHFSGKSNKSKIDNSYEAFCNRHKSIINDLKQHDSRNKFALSTIWREIARHKDQVDLGLLFQFIYRASREYSTKDLALGNTHQEIPRMVKEAYASKKIKISDLDNKIATSIEKAAKRNQSKQWDFPPPAFSSVIKKEDIGLSSMKRFFQHQYEQFKNGASVEQLAESVVQANIEKKRYCARQITQFIYHCCRSKIDEYSKDYTTDIASEITRRLTNDQFMKQSIINQQGSHSAREIWGIMCRSAERASLKNIWNFSTNQ